MFAKLQGFVGNSQQDSTVYIDPEKVQDVRELAAGADCSITRIRFVPGLDGENYMDVKGKVADVITVLADAIRDRYWVQGEQHAYAALTVRRDR